MRSTIIGSIIVLTALALVLGGCGGGGNGGAATISGRVADDGSLDWIAGARIVAPNGAETTSDNTGFFLLDNMSSGVTSITVVRDGFLAQNVPVPAGRGDKSVGTVYVIPSPQLGCGNISGTITRGGVTESGAWIRAAGKTSHSRSNGTFTVYNVPAGFQTVTATSSDGLTGGTLNVTVIAQSTVTANLQLTTRPPDPPIVN